MKRLNSNGYVSGKSEYNFVEKMKVYNKTVIYILASRTTAVLFDPRTDRSVAHSQRLRATDPFEGQTKLLLSSNPVNICIMFLPGVCIHEDNSYFSFIFLDYKIYV